MFEADSLLNIGIHRYNHNRVARDNCYILEDALTVFRQASERGDGGEGVGTGVGVNSSSEKDPIEASDENKEACDGAGSSSISSGRSEGCGGVVTRDIKVGST